MPIVYFICILCLFSTPKSWATNITECGLLSSASTTYVLQNDVTHDQTCFMINANDVILDLNGHTVTYDNAAPIPISNGSFESATMTDWDLTGAAQATRSEGIYLGRTCYAGDYALKVTAPLTTGDQAIITAAAYSLLADVQYSASVMMWQPYNTGNATNADIEMTIEILDASDSSILAVADFSDIVSSYTSRGLQYVSVAYTPAENKDVKIRLSVKGGDEVANSGQAPYGAWYFDDVRIQQRGNQGIQFGGTNAQYGVTSTWARRGKATSTAETKGAVVQGQAHGDFSDAVSFQATVPSDASSYEASNLEITVSGNSTQAIWIQNAANGLVYDNLIHSSVDTIQTRDHYDGALITVSRADLATGTAGKIYNNTIDTGIQTGIYVAGSPSAALLTEIYGNDITLQSKYTNDFGIVGGYGTYSAYVHDNTIRCGSGDNTCRGIFIHGSNGSIKDNTIEVHYNQNNQEYGLEYDGCGGAAYGIQVDPSSSNVETSGNMVTAYADQCEAAAFRFYAQPAGSTVNNLVTGNTFKAISSGTKIASTIRILETYASDMIFTNNLLVSNGSFLHHDGNVGESADRSLTINRNIFRIEYPKSDMYYPLVSQSYITGTASVPKNVTISNCLFSDATIRADLLGAVFQNIRLDYAEDTFSENIVITEHVGNLSPQLGNQSIKLTGSDRIVLGSE